MYEYEIYSQKHDYPKIETIHKNINSGEFGTGRLFAHVIDIGWIDQQSMPADCYGLKKIHQNYNITDKNNSEKKTFENHLQQCKNCQYKYSLINYLKVEYSMP